MSSTARGGKRSPADFYATRAWCVHRLLERVGLPDGVWYEPCAGDGAIIKAVNSKLLQAGRKIQWFATELRPECKEVLEPLARVDIGSFFYIQPTSKKADVLITNPSFSIAMEVIEHSLKFAHWVIHLLRLNFLGTEERNAFFKLNMPDVYVIPNRVSFAISISCACGWATTLAVDAEVIRKCPACGEKTRVSTTDSIEYAWFVWGPERGRQVGKIEVLDHTPQEQRR